MLFEILKSKIQGAVVTACNPDYVGSITIDRSLMDAVGILPYEKVVIGNLDNGNRFVTYAIPGEKGVVEVNGAAAKLNNAGDKLIILCFCMLEKEELEKHKPKIIIVDEKNVITQRL